MKKGISIPGYHKIVLVDEKEYKNLKKLVEILKKYNMVDLGDFTWDGEDCYFRHKKIDDKEAKLVWRYLEDENS